ncbi:RloB family protein [Candidatus Magnetominusculus dajiuhuensis]|uniref:RloB family protein n=1 Tax=Candidatus Magnetominusculus dajiuhuensis TaxID=3137712 RepID=UPI003B4388F0
MPRFQRKIITKPAYDKILIVCEGEKTEPNYFKKFKGDLYNKMIEIEGPGMVTKSLVNYVLDNYYIYTKPDDNDVRGFDVIWVVFDRDSNPPQDFNEAIRLAESNKIHVAYSNEAFELWYLLHFNYHDSAMSRKLYEGKLTDNIIKLTGDNEYKYEKNSEDMYDKLKEKHNTAIKNAKRLLDHYKDNDPNGLNPGKNNPSTTVHLLVEELNTYKKQPVDILRQ